MYEVTLRVVDVQKNFVGTHLVGQPEEVVVLPKSFLVAIGVYPVTENTHLQLALSNAHLSKPKPEEKLPKNASTKTYVRPTETEEERLAWRFDRL